MKQHTLSLTLAALLATTPALAADWAHNDPDKASTGKVQIWDGNKTVTVDSAPATAVATMGGGGGTALGGVVQSPLSFSQFIAANDLDATNWKDTTFKPGKRTVSIAGTELAEKTGTTSIRTFYTEKVYSGEGTYRLPPNSEYSVQNGRKNSYSEEKCSSSGRNDQFTRCSGGGACHVTGLVSSNSSSVTIGTKRNPRMPSYYPDNVAAVKCTYGFDIEPKITITSPPADGMNYFMRVN